MTAPMTDDALLALAQHRFEQADRDDATHDDCRQLRDIFPAVLQRLREKIEITRDLVSIECIDMGATGGLERMMKAVDQPANEDQFALPLAIILNTSALRTRYEQYCVQD